MEVNAGALGASQSKGVGVHNYLGVGPVSSKRISAGFKIGYNYSTTEELIAWVDINGDGLPDKLYKNNDNEKVYYRPASYNYIGKLVYGNSTEVTGLNNIGLENSHTFCYGPEAYAGTNFASIFAIYNKGNTKTTSKGYFSDVNGDGFVDFVSNGKVLYNHLINGQFRFDARAPFSMGAGNIDEASVKDIYEEIIEEFNTNNPLADIVRAWKAPYSGNINIQGAINLEDIVEGRSDQARDGIRAAIQKNGSEIWTRTIDKDDHSIYQHDLQNIAIAEGDIIYFRLNSVDDGDFDKVTWDPEISYNSIQVGSSLAAVDKNHTDTNGLYPYRFKSSEDFALMLNDSHMVAPIGGVLRLEIHIDKFKKTSDNVKLVLSKESGGTSSDIFEFDYGADEINTYGHITSTNVNPGDKLKYRFVSDTVVDPKAIKVSGEVYYTTIVRNRFDPVTGQEILDINGNPIPETCSDDDVIYKTDKNGVKTPRYKLKMAYDFNTYPKKSKILYQTPFTASDNGKIKIKVTSISRNEDAFFSIKKPLEPVYKSVLDYIEYDLAVTKDEKLYFDITTGSEAAANEILTRMGSSDPSQKLKVTVTYIEKNGSVVPEDERVEQEVECIVNWSQEYNELLPKPYRGWYYFAYNGNNGRGALPINEALIQQYLNEVENKGSSANTDPNFAENEADRIEQMAQNGDPISIPEDIVFFLYPDIEDAGNLRWESTDEDCWLDAYFMQSSRKGYNKPPFKKGEDYSGMRAVVRIGKAEQTTMAFGGSIGGGVVGANATRTDGTTYSEMDFLDVNGDGYPDVVQQGKGIQYTTSNGGIENSITNNMQDIRKVDNEVTMAGLGPNIPHLKPKGSGKNDGTQPMKPTFGLSVTMYKDAEVDTAFDLIDMNGDGLPDKVKREDGLLKVALNLGYSFTGYENWGGGFINISKSTVGPLDLDSTRIGLGLSFNSGGIYGFAGGVSYSSDSSQLKKLLRDMNGDNLPDLIQFLDNGAMEVAFNTGNSFTGFSPWTGTVDENAGDSKSYTVGAGGYITIPVGIPIIPIKLIINPGIDASTTLSEKRTAFMDIDGNGLLDQVIIDGSAGGLVVALNKTAYTNKLKTVERPLGSRFTLSYKRTGNTADMPQNKWVLSKVELYDGHSGDGIDNLLTEFDYSEGKYDRFEREFLGFANVEANQIDENGNVYRKIKKTFDTSSYFKKGLLLCSQTQENTGSGFSDIAKTVYEYDTLDLQGNPADPNTRRKFVFLVNKAEYYYEGTDYLSTYNTFLYDKYGNVVETFEAGNPGTLDDVIVKLTYLEDLVNYIVDKPESVKVFNNGALLRHREGEYEAGTGALKALRLFNGSVVSESLFEYNEYGNMIKTTGPENSKGQRHTVDINYDTVISTYPVKVIDSFGYISESNYDYRFGEVTTSKDINSQVIENRYDSFGRLIEVFSPYDGTMPSVKFKYYHNEIPARAVTHNKVFHAASNTETIDTVIFVDGLGRVIQTKKEGYVQQAGETQGYYGMNVSGLITYDAFGREVKQGQPVFQKGYDIDTFYPVLLKRLTTNIYDSKDRITEVILPDGNTISSEYSITADSFKVVTTDPEDKIKNSYTDIDGNIVKVEQFKGTQTITGTYKYNALRENVEIVDNNGNKTITSYDMLGRRTSVDNPDMGLVEYTYDAAGNLVKKIDSNLRLKSQAINYVYDFNRLVKIDYPEMQDVEYIYGAPGAPDNTAGRIKKIIDVPGDIEYAYGKLGEQTWVKRRIKYVGGLIGLGERTYITQYKFDYLGRLESIIYPDREKVTYAYDLGGQVTGIHGSKHQKDVNMYNNNCKNGIHNECYEHDYVKDIRYDEFGQRIFIKLGNGTTTNYTYDPYRRWLSNIETGDNFGVKIQNINYTFDRMGNVLGYKNTASKVVQKYTYDDLYQLIKAEGLGSIRDNSSISHYEQTFEYDNLGNMTRKTSDAKIFGSYMISSNFVQEANLTDSSKLLRDGLVNPDWCEKPHEEIYKFTYEYTNPKPHAPRRIGNWVFEYDGNGNTVKRWRVLVDSSDNVIKYDEDTVNFGPSDTFKWDEENRLKKSVVKGKPTIYVYDYSGKRTNKSHENSEEVYVNEFYQERHNREGIKNIYVGNTRLVSKRFTVTNLINENFDQNKEYRDVYYYHKDHLGSANIMSDFEGRRTQHYENKPYGESWINEKRDHIFVPYLFNGKEYDQENRLYYYGARYLDPMFSRWLSPDPALESYIPTPGSGTDLPGMGGVFSLNNLNVYHYANNNPISYTDPDGRSNQASVGRIVYDYAMQKHRENLTNEWNRKVNNFMEKFQRNNREMLYHSTAGEIYEANLVVSLIEANNGVYKGGFYLGNKKLPADVKLDLLNAEFIVGASTEFSISKYAKDAKAGLKYEMKYDILNGVWSDTTKPRIGLSSGDTKAGNYGLETKIPLAAYGGVYIGVDPAKSHKPLLLKESYVDIYTRLKNELETNN
ncbi:MAG: RHS repeat domain-containing protein [Bacillota bacterium]